MDRYSFCHSRTLEGLRASVNRELASGYELVGGPFVFKQERADSLEVWQLICQAVMAPKEEKDES